MFSLEHAAIYPAPPSISIPDSHSSFHFLVKHQVEPKNNIPYSTTRIFVIVILTTTDLFDISV